MPLPDLESAAPPICYSVKDAVKATGFSRSRLYLLLNSGEIEARKIGRRTVIPATSLAAFVDRQPRAVFRPPAE